MDKQVAEVSGLRSTKPNTHYKYLSNCSKLIL